MKLAFLLSSARILGSRLALAAALLVAFSVVGGFAPALVAHASSSSLQDADVNDPAVAGYATTIPGTYIAAQVKFIVPTLTPTVNGAKVAYTAEIGARGAAVVDGGIYSYLDASGNQINKAYWEFYNPTSGLDKTEEFSLSGGHGGGVVSTGDRIFASVNADANGDNFAITDMTTGDTGSYILSGNDSMPDSSAAGCFVLSPLGASVPVPLANFGRVDMQGCQVADAKEMGIPVVNSPISDYNPVTINMIDNIGLFTAVPSKLPNGGQDFSVYYFSSLPSRN